MRIDFKIGDSVEFIIDYTKITSYGVEFTVDEVVSWELTGETLQTERYLEGFIKWDSCSHFWFGDNGYIHICGVDSYVKHCKLLRFLYNKAFELMDRKPEKGEEWTDE